MLQILIFSFLSSIFLETKGEKFIINTDAGADDAVAIITLLNYAASVSSEKFEVIGITCSYGNVNERQAEINLLNTLEVVGHRNFPVYAGAEQGFLEEFKTDNFFGLDGFGNVNFTDDQTTVKIDRSKHAAVALVDMVKKYPGKVSIISLGPTTNIALAISLDSKFMKKVNKIHVMGGSVNGTGNKDPNVEFNFAADPESNALLFDKSKESQIILYPWENTLNTIVKKDWRINVLGKYKNPYVRFLNLVERVNLEAPGSDWISADALAIAAIIDRRIVLAEQNVNVYPVVQGEARGSVLADYFNTTHRIRNAKIVSKLNVTAYKKLLIRYLGCDENNLNC